MRTFFMETNSSSVLMLIVLLFLFFGNNSLSILSKCSSMVIIQSSFKLSSVLYFHLCKYISYNIFILSI